MFFAACDTESEPRESALSGTREKAQQHTASKGLSVDNKEGGHTEDRRDRSGNQNRSDRPGTIPYIPKGFEMC
jgi:hypothetical protein